MVPFTRDRPSVRPICCLLALFTAMEPVTISLRTLKPVFPSRSNTDDLETPVTSPERKRRSCSLDPARPILTRQTSKTLVHKYRRIANCRRHFYRHASDRCWQDNSWLDVSLFIGDCGRLEPTRYHLDLNYTSPLVTCVLCLFSLLFVLPKEGELERCRPYR